MKAFQHTPELLAAIKKTTKIQTLTDDGYDDNDRPMFVSLQPKYEYIEWTIDEHGGVWQHESGDTCIGAVSKSLQSNVESDDEEEHEDTPSLDMDLHY